MMKAYSYVIEHDLGFAPNPFHGVCTLACCKPQIRKTAAVGDYVLGLGAARPKLGGHLCYWMRVDEILTFDRYWEDVRFRRKRPNMRATTYLRYGDNIYHRRNGEGPFLQEYSFHSLPGGALSQTNLQRDTGTSEKVLLSRTFAYFGAKGVPLPPELKAFEIRGPGHKNRFTPEQVSALLAWLETLPGKGFVGEPAHWQFLSRKRRRVAALVATHGGHAS